MKTIENKCTHNFFPSNYMYPKRLSYLELSITTNTYFYNHEKPASCNSHDKTHNQMYIVDED